VGYRETIRIPAEVRHRFIRQTGGKGMFADVSLRVEPLEPGKGFVFENEIVGGSIPKEFIPAVEKGLKIEKEGGLLIGFPVIAFTESAAPPRASPSSFVRTTPSNATCSWNASATFTASWPVIASSTSRMLSGLTASRTRASSSSHCRAPSSCRRD